MNVLIEITARGVVSFVFQFYENNTSARHITKTEFIEKFEPGDAVIADRGFTFGDLLLKRSGKLNLTSLQGSKKKEINALNQSEVSKTRNTASLGIHVERAIKRMQNFKILNQIISFTFWTLLYKSLEIFAIIYNFQPPLY